MRKLLKLIIAIIFISVFSSCRDKQANTWYVKDFEYDEIPIKNDNTNTEKYHIDYMIDDKIYSGILDTGSDITTIIVQDSTAKSGRVSYVIRYDGKFDTLDLKGFHRVKLGKAEIINQRIYLETNNKIFSKSNILGRNILRGAVIQIDNYNNCIKLATNDNKIEPKGMPIECRFDEKDNVYVYLKIKGEKREFLIDTGFYDEIAIGNDKYNSDIFKNSITVTFDIKENINEKLTLCDVSLGGKTFKNCNIKSGTTPFYLLGTKFLSRFKTITIDYINKRLFMELPESHTFNDKIKFDFDKDTINAVSMEWLFALYKRYNAYSIDIMQMGDIYKVISTSLLSNSELKDFDLTVGDTIIGVNNYLFTDKYLSQFDNRHEYRVLVDNDEQLNHLTNTMWLKSEGLFHYIKNGKAKSIKLKRRKFLVNEQNIAYTYSKPVKPIFGMALNFYIDKKKQLNVYIPWKEICGEEYRIESKEKDSIVYYTNISPDSVRYKVKE